MHRLLPLLMLLLLTGHARAGVEVTLPGKSPVVIEEVYWRDGVAYVALEDVLKAAGLKGKWDSVAHVYRLEAAVPVLVYPERRQVRVGERFVELDQPPHFIDGRLRVPASFAAGPLAAALGTEVGARSLDPPPAGAAVKQEETGLDRLFSLLLHRKESAGLALRGIVVDPGHGGQDPGSLGLGGCKEKTVTLEVARRLEKQIKMKLALPVHLSRNDDYAVTAEQRLQAANRDDVDVLLQLHAQGAFVSSPHGIELYVRPREETTDGALPAGEGGSMRLARYLADALRAAGFEVAGIAQAPLLPLGRGDLPTVLVELGYLTSPLDQPLLCEAAGQEKLAAALYEGVRRFGEAWKEEAAK